MQTFEQLGASRCSRKETLLKPCFHFSREDFLRLDDDVDWCETDEVNAIHNSHLPSGNILAVIIDAIRIRIIKLSNAES